jgi:EAL domain-containing protein (putative c-di-GMP-specific phosphodiesterase class I)
LGGGRGGEGGGEGGEGGAGDTSGAPVAASMRSAGFAVGLQWTTGRLARQFAADLFQRLSESGVLDFQRAKAVFGELRKTGLKIAIDDFGTGYSSLSKLQSLDIDVVKIDQSFVHKLASDHQSRALCETIVSIGRSLEIAIVAEGVETVEQLQILQAMNCDEVQGYLISRPVLPEDIPPLIAKKFF